MEIVSPPPTILIVDDDRGVARLIEKAVRREGFATAIALSGEEAIAWLKDHRADLMLLDLKLPDYLGPALLDRLTAISCAVPFIIITGQGDERVAVDMMKRGALDYLVKDVQFLEFVPTVVRRALKQLDQQKRLKVAEEDLRLFRSLVDQSSDTLEIIDPATARFLDVNEKGPSELGCTRAEYLSRRVMDIDPTITEVVWCELMEQMRAAGPQTGEGLHRREDGTTFPIEFRARLVRLDREYVVVVVRDITERKRMEQALLQASDEERQRIGRDLHDGLGQEITAISFLNYVLKDSLKAKALPEAESAERLALMISHAGSEVRRISHGLQPVGKEPESLDASLKLLVQNSNQVNGTQCTFRKDHLVKVHNHASANHLYRIAQEAVQNALRHGGPEEVIVSLTRIGERVILEVRDDGAGFDPGGPKSEGIGLSTMRYRIESMRGSIEFTRPPEGGMLLRCSIPDPQPMPRL